MRIFTTYVCTTKQLIAQCNYRNNYAINMDEIVGIVTWRKCKMKGSRSVIWQSVTC